MSFISFIETKENTGILQLTIIDGLDLEGVDSSGTSDPYCVILMNNEKVGKTKTHKKTNSPQFNETFYIPIKHRQRTNFVIQVFDYNNISRDLLLGTISIPLSNVSAGELLEGCYPIEGAPTGKLNIQILFEASTNREMSQVLGGKSTSVTYLPPIKTNSVESDLEFKSSLPELYAAKSLFSAEDLSKPSNPL